MATGTRTKAGLVSNLKSICLRCGKLVARSAKSVEPRSHDSVAFAEMRMGGVRVKPIGTQVLANIVQGVAYQMYTVLADNGIQFTQ